MDFNNEREPKKLHRIMEWMVDCAVMVILASYLVSCFGFKVEIGGNSMRPLLESGDVVLVNRLSYQIGSPKRFDLAVFFRDGQTPGVKRIIGLPGETVQIKDGKIYIDGSLLEAKNKLELVSLSGIAADPIKLGQDEYFVLGDDRESSEDSRFYGIGNIKRRDLMGKVWLRFQPFSRFGLVS